MNIPTFSLEDRLDSWYKKSSVKNYPRRKLLFSEEQQFFPLARQPIAIHPLVEDCGERAVSFVLTQTAYRYLYDIAMIETECVNQVALNIANDSLFPVDMHTQQQALSVIVDEAYHAFVALDAIEQIEKATQIQRFHFKRVNPVRRGLDAFSMTSDHEHFKYLQFIAVCLSEHVLTQDLVSIKQADNNCLFFNQIMSDHLIDEGMHAAFFSQLLSHFYHHTEQSLQIKINRFIPVFIDAYLNVETQKQFDKELLLQIGLGFEKAMEVIEDTYFTHALTNNPALLSFLSVLRRSKILTDDSSLFDSLSQFGLIETPNHVS